MDDDPSLSMDSQVYDEINEGSNPQSFLQKPLSINEEKAKKQFEISVTTFSRFYKNPKAGSEEKNKRRIEVELEPESPHLNETYEVFFPFEPYETQLKMIQATFESILSKQHALAESPTGTGKSLVLLTSALSFLAKKNENPKSMKVVYLSRTHSQLSQVIKELKKTPYEPTMTILGSRDQLCINHTIAHLKGAAKNKACETMQVTRSCQYFSGLKNAPEKEIKQLSQLQFNIEELIEVGHSRTICPFYVTRELVPYSHLILMPYIYAIHYKYRNNNPDLFNNAIMIFDEAHNILESMEDGSSVTLSVPEIEATIEEAITVRQMLQTDAIKSLMSPKEVDALKVVLEELKEQLKDKLPSTIEPRFTRAEEIISIFTSKSTSEEIASEKNIRSKIIDLSKKGLTIEKLYTLVSSMYGAARFMKTMGHRGEPKLAEIAESLAVVKDIWTEHTENKGQQELLEDFRLIYSKDDLGTPKLELLCLDPGYTFSKVLNSTPRNVIFTSGTLSPFQTFESELRSSFPIKFSGDHVISTQQGLVGIVPVLNEVVMEFSYAKRDNKEMLHEFGKSLEKWLKITPQGVLVFFASYKMMYDCVDKWRQNGQLDRLRAIKTLCIESRNPNEQFENINLYCNSARKGAVFFSVAGGKLSEGFDFTDYMARLVIVLGVPFPNTQDMKLQAKKSALSSGVKVSNRRQRLSFDDFYVSKTMRGVNQIIGRAIRHANDFGAALLVDSRYCFDRQKRLLSSWAQKCVQQFTAEDNVETELSRFFKRNESRLNFVNKFDDQSAQEALKAIKAEFTTEALALPQKNSDQPPRNGPNPFPKKSFPNFFAKKHEAGRSNSNAPKNQPKSVFEEEKKKNQKKNLYSTRITSFFSSDKKKTSEHNQELKNEPQPKVESKTSTVAVIPANSIDKTQRKSSESGGFSFRNRYIVNKNSFFDEINLIKADNDRKKVNLGDDYGGE